MSRYNPTSKDVGVRDYCAWYGQYSAQFNNLGHQESNYVLLTLSLPSATNAVIRLMGTAVSSMNHRALV